MVPKSMAMEELKSLFTKKHTWDFIPYDRAEVCNLLRFETMHLTVFIGVRDK